MYRAKLNKASALAVAQWARARAFPALLVASTTVVVVGAGAFNKVTHCQHDPSLQAEAKDLKERVQEFTEHVLELADNPPPSSSGRPRHDHGHGSPFFTSGGYRRIEPRHEGLNFSGSSTPSYDGYSGRGGMERFRGATVNKDEELVPAVLYITGAAIIGSFLARHSNFMVKFLSPTALALGAGAYTIPKTTNNVIYGLKHYDYREWNREWHHKWQHARQSVTDTTHNIQTGLGSVASGAKDAAHEISDQSHKLSDKAQHALHDAKETTTKVAHDVQAKGAEVSKTVSHQLDHAKDEAQEGVKAAKQYWQSAEHTTDKEANDLKKSAQETGEHVKHWWQSAERDAEKHAKEFKGSAQETGENARDWFQDQGRRMHREASNYGRDDFERGFDRFKNKARQDWSNARDEVESRGRTVQKNLEDARDQGQKWVRDRSREEKDRLHNLGDQGQEWTREWADERRHDIESVGRDLGDRFDDAKHDYKKFGREAREYGEDRFRDARRDIRNRADDVKDHGLRQFNRFEQEADRAGSWGHGRREGDDRDQRGWGYGNFGGSRYEQYDNEPRRSVTEAAKEGRHWWQHKDAADPYESYDRQRPSSGGTWWKGSSSATQATDKMSDDFDRSRRQVKRNVEDLRDRAEDTAENGRSWLSDKTHQLKDRFEHGKSDFQNKLGELTAHGYREEQGRDFGGRFGATHNHASIYSDDYWFHSDHSADAPRSGRRGGDRGL
ncbi:hypothetical protein BG006_008770 [Podila minutissima]|uniref:MICOS complex subunit n=1 Tax=Podila minutissima TaxID=64525 RepID=A0A9P5VJU1_9FUNG|nr:hypothetical protein BG006_008770 [Podila minutissima]